MRAYLPFLMVLGVSCTAGEFEGIRELSSVSADSDMDQFSGLAFARPVGCIQTGNIVKDYFPEAFMQVKIDVAEDEKFWVEVCVVSWVTIKIPAFEEFDLRNDCADKDVTIAEDGKFSLGYKVKGSTVTLIAVLSEDGDEVEVKSLGVIGSYQLVKSAELHRCPDDACAYDPYSCEGLYIPPPPDTDMDTGQCHIDLLTMTFECE